MGLTGALEELAAAAATLGIHTRTLREEELETRQHVLHLRRRHLQLRLARARALRKDDEDEHCPIEHLHLLATCLGEHVLDVAALGRRELLVEDDCAHAHRFHQSRDLVELALTDEGRR